MLANQVTLHFMKWCEVHDPGWVDRHVFGFVPLAGSLLGAPAAIPRLLSGEMKDISDMGVLGAALDMFASLPERRALMRTWGSLYQLLPRGGGLVWGGGSEKDPEGKGLKDDPKAGQEPASGQAGQAGQAGGPRLDGARAGEASPHAAIDYDAYNEKLREEDVKVSFKVISDARGANVANRSHGRAAAIAAQERELRFNKEQDVLKNLVRNQVSLESRYTKEADRAAKLQRINHAGKSGGASSRLFNANAAAKGPF